MTSPTDAPLQLQPTDLDTWRRDGHGVTILDVREPWEVEICRLSDSVNIPLGQLPGRVGELGDGMQGDGRLVVLCHHGARSLQAVRWLRANGWPAASNLDGGIDAWARQVEPTMGVY
ncbi:MAG TPA: rhodanese-like domain-containing protein [Stellaceae bacterium]|nr:rhodanese-like domain-containing protein [Stellaceae bacterium]